MTKDEILEALRLMAHGRVNHPLIERLAEYLADLTAPAAGIVEAAEEQPAEPAKRGRKRA